MGQFQPKPYWQRQKDGSFKKIQPEPKEFLPERKKCKGSGGNHFNYDLVLVNSLMNFSKF
jgi:hypothetical protein